MSRGESVMIHFPRPNVLCVGSIHYSEKGYEDKEEEVEEEEEEKNGRRGGGSRPYGSAITFAACMRHI